MLLRRTLLAVSLLLAVAPTGWTQTDDPTEWWQDLRGADAKQAFASMWKFVDHPERAMTFLPKRLAPIAKAPEDKLIAQLIVNLNDDSFRTRTEARNALEKLAELVEPQLRQALEKKPAVEAEQTLIRLLKNLDGPAANRDQLAQFRALEILAHISLSPQKVPADQARKLLHDLAQGIPQARLTAKARDTLAQLQTRPASTIVEPLPGGKDLFGDPLPKGAVARLGTSRFRHSLAAFTPDGKTLVGVSPSGLYLTDLAAGRESRSFAAKRLSDCLDVVVSPNGRFLAVNGFTEDAEQAAFNVHVWDLIDGKPLHQFVVSQDRPALMAQSVMAFSADSKLLYAGNKTTLHVWDMTTGKEDSFFTHALPTERPPGVVVVSPRGKYMITGSGGEQLVHLWDLAGGVKLHSLENPANDIGMVSAAFSHDEKLAAIGNRNGQVKLYGSAKGEWQRTLTTSGKAVGLAFSPDGRTLAVACNDRFHAPVGAEIFLYNLDNGAELPRRFPAPDVRWLRFSPDGRTLAFGSWDNAVTLIDAATGKDLYPREAHLGPIVSLVWAQDGKHIVTGSDDHTARLWDAHTGRSLSVFRGHAGRISSVALSVDGRCLATGSADGSVIVWNMADGTRKYLLRNHQAVHAVLFSPDGKYLVTSGVYRAYRMREASVRIFDAASGKESKVFDRSEPVQSLAFSPDGRVLALAGVTGVRLREFPSGKLLHSFESEYRVDGAAFSPDGRTLAVNWVGGNARIQLFEMLTKEERGDLPGHLDMMYMNWTTQVSFSPDARYLACCGLLDSRPAAAGAVRVWNLATGKETGSFEGHRSYVNCLSFAPDGRRLATGGVDASVLIWNCQALAAGK